MADCCQKSDGFARGGHSCEPKDALDDFVHVESLHALVEAYVEDVHQMEGDGKHCLLHGASAALEMR